MRYTFAIAVIIAIVAGPAAADNETPTFRFFFMDGTVVTGRLVTAAIDVRAPDGTVRKLRAANVRDMTPGFVSRPKLFSRARKLIAQLSAKSWHDRKAAHAALAAMGPAIGALLEDYRKDADLERRMRIEVMLSAFRTRSPPLPYELAPPRCAIRPTDRVTLHDSGEVVDRSIVTQRIDIASVYGSFSVAVTDLNSIRRVVATPAEPKYDKPDRIEIALVGGKVVKGTAAAPTLTIRTPRGNVAMPVGLMSRLAFSPDRKTVGVIFRNGDHLVGQAIVPGAFKIKSPDGKAATVPIASIGAMSVTPGFVPAGLICWNRLDGSASIVGPEATFASIDAFVAGKVAKGVQVSPTKGEAISMPAALLKNAPAGTIEFWTKTLSMPTKKPPSANRVRGASSTIAYFEMLHGPLSLMCRYYTSGGRANSYVYLRCGGQMVRSDPKKKGQDAKVLFTPGQWNHVAVVWNVKGIKQFGGAPLAMLVNGKPFGIFANNPRAGDPMRDYPFPARLVLHRSRSTSSPTVVYDELKIWNRVVTDFKP